MTIEKNFGIGSYHFGVRKNPPFEFKGSDYLSELKRSLSQISNLDNLTIESDKEFENVVQKITDPLPNSEDEGGFFPDAFQLEISFELYIPFRIQAELGNTEEKFLRTFSEKFKIHLFQSYYFPVAIIETLNPSKENDPSKAVQIVREFIRKELTPVKSPFIRFECIGPSPFHLDCYIKPEKPQEVNANWLINPIESIERGYDKIIFYYNSKEIKDSDEALEYVMSSIMDEFGLCYKYIQLRQAKMHSWAAIQNLLQELQEMQTAKGIKGYFSRLFKRPALIGKLFTDLAGFEAGDIFDEKILQNEYDEVYRIKDELYFKTFIDKEFRQKYEYPVKQITDLVKFYEGRRVKSVELIIAIIAAILGGAIGAMVTIYFQTQPTIPTP
jgi:hypothetical protein